MPLLCALLLDFLLACGPLLGRKRAQGAVLALLQSALLTLNLALNLNRGHCLLPLGSLRLLALNCAAGRGSLPLWKGGAL